MKQRAPSTKSTSQQGTRGGQNGHKAGLGNGGTIRGKVFAEEQKLQCVSNYLEMGEICSYHSWECFIEKFKEKWKAGALGNLDVFPTCGGMCGSSWGGNRNSRTKADQRQKGRRSMASRAKSHWGPCFIWELAILPTLSCIWLLCCKWGMTGLVARAVPPPPPCLLLHSIPALIRKQTSKSFLFSHVQSLVEMLAQSQRFLLSKTLSHGAALHFHFKGKCYQFIYWKFRRNCLYNMAHFLDYWICSSLWKCA